MHKGILFESYEKPLFNLDLNLKENALQRMIEQLVTDTWYV